MPGMMKKGAMYQAGGRVRKYAEGGKISDRSALKGQRETSLQRLQALGMNPAGLGLGVDESPIPIRPRGMFNIDPQQDPRRQREREVSRRRQEADDRVNRESARERQRLANIEAKLEESEENMPGMKKYQEGGPVRASGKRRGMDGGQKGVPVMTQEQRRQARSMMTPEERREADAPLTARELEGMSSRYKKGGMVKKKAGGVVKKAMGGMVRKGCK